MPEPGGEDALAQLTSRRFDVVILDLRMQDLDGFDVLARSRNRAARALAETE